MQLTFKPGFVYIFHSKSRPRDVKIGKTLDVKDREFQLALGDPDLTLHACQFFLDVFSAEGYLHALFADKRISREHFRVSRQKALAALETLAQSREQERHEFVQQLRWMADVGELLLDSSADVPQCEGSALSVLLAYMPSPKDGRNVKALVSSALVGGAAGEAAARLLHKVGLLAYAPEGIVLFDRSKNSAMDRLYKGKPVAATWRKQLEKFAGVRENGKSVSMNLWADKTTASRELIDRVTGLV